MAVYGPDVIEIIYDRLEAFISNNEIKNEEIEWTKDPYKLKYTKDGKVFFITVEQSKKQS